MSSADDQALAAELGRLREELTQADIHLDRLGAHLAASRGETARWRMEAGQAAADSAAMAAQLASLRDALAARDGVIDGIARDLQDREREAAKLRLEIGTLRAASALSAGVGAQASAAAAVRPGTERAPSRMHSGGQETKTQQALVDLLKDIAGILAGQGKWWQAILPGFWLRRIAHSRLRRRGLFDAALYRQRYPDVARTGMDPVRHYVLYGLEEGRRRD